MSSASEPGAVRLIGYDVARALAFFGMVLVNFKIVMGASGAGPAWLVDAAGLLEGRAAAVQESPLEGQLFFSRYAAGQAS